MKGLYFYWNEFLLNMWRENKCFLKLVKPNFSVYANMLAKLKKPKIQKCPQKTGTKNKNCSTKNSGDYYGLFFWSVGLWNKITTRIRSTLIYVTHSKNSWLYKLYCLHVALHLHSFNIFYVKIVDRLSWHITD